MGKMNISQATEAIWDLIEELEQAYWEAGDLAAKDNLFNLIQIMNREYMETLKISVQDHHFDYEVISLPLQQLMPILNNLMANLPDICRRHHTRIHLEDHLGMFIRSIGPG